MQATKQNNKLKCAIILSIVLHCILIAVLIWSSIHQLQEISISENSASIDAMIVDPGSVMQQYNSRQQRDKQIQTYLHVEQQKQKKKEAAKQAHEQQKQSKTAIVKQQDKVEVKQAATKVRKKAEVKKEPAVAQKRAATEAAKQSKEVDDLLSRLTDNHNMLQASSQLTGMDSSKQRDSSGMEIDTYQAMISNAIKNKFYDYTNYLGKTCDLRIKLGPDGRLISVSIFDGDPMLCQAAVSAAKAANIPRPPSLQIYEIFKNTTIKFTPQ